MNDTARGAGWMLFAGIMIFIAGTLNTIWGIAAIDKASFFVEDERYIISDLSTWGWIVLIIGDHAADRRVLDLGRQRVRPLDRHHHRDVERNRSTAVDPGLPFWSLAVFCARHPRDLRTGRLRWPAERASPMSANLIRACVKAAARCR